MPARSCDATAHSTLVRCLLEVAQGVLALIVERGKASYSGILHYLTFHYFRLRKPLSKSFLYCTTRAARFCHAAAHGGQVTAPLEVVQKVIAEWTGRACPDIMQNTWGPTVMCAARVNRATQFDATGVLYPMLASSPSHRGRV